MATKANIIKVYAQADSAKKVDIIIRYYPNFMGIVESYTDGLRYMIENEKAFNRQANRGELGVRVQAKGNHSDITGNSAVASVMTREALVACDFSGDVLEGIDRQEEFKQESFTLRTMRLDYELFNSGFVFTTAYHTVYSAAAVNNAIHRATKAYNDKEEKEAKKDGREPLLLPDFSAHHLRHTFCTRLCENETNLKVIMDIMGHADISTTMDIYAECTKEKKKEVMTNIEGCIIIK